MKKTLQHVIIIGCILFVYACSSPLDKRYNESTVTQDLKEISDSKKVDTTDTQYMAMYIMRAKFIGEKLDGKTYKDILENAKELKTKNDKEKSNQK